MNYSFKRTLIIFLYILVYVIRKTSSRRAKGHSNKCCTSECTTSDISFWVLLGLILMASLMFLVMLGITKGLVGLFLWAPVGMWGIGALIDLPQPLECYQESELVDIPVVYDQIGWPVHPETKKRSVRAIAKSTEFYLNIIFFLAYPLTILVTLCGSCCFKDTCGCESENYRYVNTIVFTKLDSPVMATKRGCDCGMYYDEDSTEEKDTKYVLQQMHQSQQSLQQVINE